MAHTRPVGTPCTLTYDTDREVAIGDVVQTVARQPAHYLVTGARRVRGAHYPHRWSLECVRIGPGDVDEDAVIHVLHWYPRGRKSNAEAVGV